MTESKEPVVPKSEFQVKNPEIWAIFLKSCQKAGPHKKGTPRPSPNPLIGGNSAPSPSRKSIK